MNKVKIKEGLKTQNVLRRLLKKLLEPMIREVIKDRENEIIESTRRVVLH